MDRAHPPTVYQMNVMTFGATCSPSSAQFVMRRNAEEFREEFPDAESLTPNHFLLGGANTVICPGAFDSTDLCLRKTWRVAQALTDLYWRRWVKEYLPELTRRTRWHRCEENLKVGDVVVVVDDKLPRGCWPKGMVQSTHPGKDGVVRFVDVKTASGIYRRPVVKAAKLDVSA